MFNRIAVPVIVALGLAGSILAGGATAASASPAYFGPSAHTVAAAPASFYHG